MQEMDGKSIPYTKEYITRLVEIEEKKATEQSTSPGEIYVSQEDIKRQQETKE